MAKWDFDPAWSMEDALAASDAALKANPDRHFGDPTLPFQQWYAHHRLEENREHFERTRDGYCILQSLAICCSYSVVPPGWLARAFSDAYGKVALAKVKSWDDAFGKPFPKGIQVKRLHLKKMHATNVYFRVQELHLAGEPIDVELFEKVGKEYGLGKTLASEYYYEACPKFHKDSKTRG